MGKLPQPPAGSMPPVAVTLPPALTADLLILAALNYDWKNRGRPHPAYLVGGGAALATQVPRVPLRETATWSAFATWFITVLG